MSTQPKELIFEEEAREALRQGIKKLMDVVGVTLGPKGRYVGIDLSWGSPKITNDGNSIIKEIELKDQYANMGVSIGKEVVTKMKEKCGDGSTTSVLLLGSLVEYGVRNIASGTSPILLKRGMEKAAEAVIAELQKKGTAVSKDSEVEDIATASASGDEEIGKMIAEAFRRVGKSGVVSIEEGKGIETSIEIVEGMQFNKGYSSSYFCTNMEKMLCSMMNPRILVTDKKISSIQEILPILQATAAAAQELLIIADDIEGDALSTLVINKLRGTLKVCAVKAPGFGDQRKALLQDIASITGATLVSEDIAMTLKNVESSMLGGAENILITKETTTIVNGEGKPKNIQERIKQIEAESKIATNSYDKEKLEERKAKLSGGVAVIRVGAPTESALKQKKRTFEDSLNSTRAALEEGVVIGGGIALLRAAKTCEKNIDLTKDELLGAKIVFQACAFPFKQLVANSGHDSNVMLEEILGQKESIGFNVKNEKVEDLLKAGIRDPLKIVKNALKFAISGAGIVLLSECLIGNAPEKEERGE